MSAETGLSSFLGFWLICGFVAWAIGSSRGVSGGFWWGLLLGPLGILVAIFSKPAATSEDRAARMEGRRQCPHCAEFIRAEAKVCRFCHRDVEPLVAAGGGVPCGCGHLNPYNVNRCERCHKLLIVQ